MVDTRKLTSPTTYVQHVQGRGVPGGHTVIGKIRADGTVGAPWLPQTRETRSIPLRHTDVVVDIGSYVGTYALTAARFPVRKVVAYEPTPSTFQILLAQERPSNLECVQAAVVADDAERAQLHISSGVGASNRLAALASRRLNTVEVPAVAYAEAVAGATVVKIDVEGAEYDYPVVQPSLRAVIIDFHVVASRDWRKDAERLVEELRDNGFRSVVEPGFTSVWNRAGSWVREAPEPLETHEAMLRGRECCGCGAEISAQGRGLCCECWETWRPRHRLGYSQDEMTSRWRT